MTPTLDDFLRWQRLAWWAFPRSWRRDGRAEDMVCTAADKADSEGRPQIGILELADLVVFGLRMRWRPWWRATPVSARLITGWAGVTGGIVLTVAATTRPWVATSDPAAPVGTLSRPTLLLALWVVLAVAVLLRWPAVVRAAAVGVLVAIPASLLSAAPAGLAGVASPAAERGLLLFDPNLAWSAVFYLGLPIWMCAWLTLGAAPVVRTATATQVALVAAAGGLGAVLTRVHTDPPFGDVWLGAPYYIGRFAIAALLVFACLALLLLVVNPRATPAAVIAAGPWVLPASIVLIGPGHLAVFVWLAAWLVLATASAVAWLRSGGTHPLLV